jgi:hypothetical protein
MLTSRRQRMRNRWTTWLATSALVLLVGSGITAFRADAADAAKKDLPFPGRGVAGWEIVRKTDTVTNGNQLTVSCQSAGKKVLGGGGQVGSNDVLLGAFPTGDSTWAAVGRSGGTAGSVEVTVYAVCARVS